MSQNIFAMMDDPVFPATQRGREILGVFESVPADSKTTDAPDKVQSFARQQARTNAMSAVLAWIEDGDFSYQALDEYIIGAADLDGDFEITEAEEAYYNEIWREVPDALLTLGAAAEDVSRLVNDEDDKAGAIVGKAVNTAVNELEADDDELIVGFAMGKDAVFENASDDPNGRHMILEATYKKMKAVRDGQVQVINKRMSGKVRLSSAQRAGIKKMQRKSHTASANLARKKSMRVRKMRGMS